MLLWLHAEDVLIFDATIAMHVACFLQRGSLVDASRRVQQWVIWGYE